MPHGRTYLEQAESGYPAEAALLVLRAQHPQLLCLLQHFVRLLKEVKEDVVSVHSQSEGRPGPRQDGRDTHTQIGWAPRRGPDPPRLPRGRRAPQGRTLLAPRKAFHTGEVPSVRPGCWLQRSSKQAAQPGSEVASGGGSGRAYLEAEAELGGGVVLLLAGDHREDAAVLQVGQQLQVPGLL